MWWAVPLSEPFRGRLLMPWFLPMPCQRMIENLILFKLSTEIFKITIFLVAAGEHPPGIITSPTLSKTQKEDNLHRSVDYLQKQGVEGTQDVTAKGEWDLIAISLMKYSSYLRLNNCFILSLISVSQQNSAHAKTAQLSWYVQIYVVIRSVFFESYPCKFSSIWKIVWNTVNARGPSKKDSHSQKNQIYKSMMNVLCTETFLKKYGYVYALFIIHQLWSIRCFWDLL